MHGSVLVIIISASILYNSGNPIAEKNNYFRSTRRQDDYEALESATLKEADQGCSRCNPTETETKIKNGFAEVFNQFQSIESQNDVSFG